MSRDDEPTRRDFVQLVAAGMAAFGLDGCVQQEPEAIVPYVRRPRDVIPGRRTFYATTYIRDGYGVGVLGETHLGRPTKIEGNRLHPASLGAAGPVEQASVIDLYDPDRIRQLRAGPTPRSWRSLMEAVGPASERPWTDRQGAGLHFLLEPTGSRLRGAILDQIRARYPRAEVHFAPLPAPTAQWQATEATLGRVYEIRYDFTQAERIVALDSDFLAGQPYSLRWAHDWAERRRIHQPWGEMNRMYVVESAVTPTGISADHRLAVPGDEVLEVSAALLGAVLALMPGAAPADVATATAAALERSRHRPWIEAVAADLVAHRGRDAIIAGGRQPVATHVLAIALNTVLGAVGEVVGYAPTPIYGAGTEMFDPRRLMGALEAGDADTVVMLEVNPAYEFPPDLRWRELIRRAPQRVHLSRLTDETAEAATWLVPGLHDFERWGDARAYDGTASFVQPLVRPLVEGRSVDGLLAMYLDELFPDLRAALIELWGQEDFVRGVRQGVLPETTFPTRALTSLDWEVVRRAIPEPRPRPEGLVLDILLDPRLGDGSRANNQWLQELPAPVSKLVYDNALFLAPATARKYGIEDNGSVVELRTARATARVPVFIQPGQAEDAGAIWLGFGRAAGGRTAGRGLGVDVGPFRTLDAPWIVGPVEVRPTDDQYELVTTQPHRDMHGRPIVLHQTLEGWRKHPHFAEPFDERPPTILPDRLPEEGYPQWGMVVDQTVCIDCASCVVACQIENNVPVVGKEQVALRRNMHWLRIDVYFEGDEADPKWMPQPMLCVHCEKAPCEYVCPVAATSHSHDGINEMTYNRCIGTRYCSNNCPYKVRRFNYLDWNTWNTRTIRLFANPEVTVRERGVMEKCTYCVQRLRRVMMQASVEGRPVAGDEVQTACQETCPTHAIVFGVINDPTSHVAKRRIELHAYGVLSNLNTQPRTRHLARITHPNPLLEG